MTYRAEVLHLHSDEIEASLGEFNSATESRAACAQHEGGVLSWMQLWAGTWEAEGLERWYWVINSQ